MRTLWHWLASVFRRSRLEENLSDELRFHIERKTEDLVRAGLSADEAARRARIQFGAVEAYKERCREANGLAWLDELHGNLRYTLRTLRMNPGFTLAAVLSLAVGIGVNTSAFAFVYRLVLHPFPFPHLERIMVVWGWNTKLGVQQRRVAPGNFLDWKQNTRAFENLAAQQGWRPTLTEVDSPERVEALQVSADFFDVFEMHPRLGRGLSDGDCVPGRDAVAIISDGFWKSRLASMPQPIGKAISLDNRTFTVIGVMPEEFDYPLGTDLWTPLALTAEQKTRRDEDDLYVVGRLKDSVTIQQAQAEMSAISAELERRYPKTNEGRGVFVKSLREDTNQVTDRFTLILLGAATFVLLLAGANVANLQLARSTARLREIGLRAALGASRFRIARELMTESIVIGVLAGVVGLMLASWDLRLTMAWIPAQVYRWVAGMRNLHVDAGMAAFGLAVAIVASLACSLPAIYQLLQRRGHEGLNDALKEGGRGSIAGSARSRLRSTLVVVEVALSLLLLVGAGLMVRTFQRIASQNLGFDPKNVLIMNVWRSPADSRDTARIAPFYSQVLERVNALPGVEIASVDGDVGGGARFLIEGRTEPRPGEPRPGINAVSAGYFRALRIPLVEGRPIEERDGADAPRAVVISQAMARHYWPGSSPIGQRVQLWGGKTPWLSIVGVCGDVKNWMNGAVRPEVYVSYHQTPSPFMTLSVRSAGDPIAEAVSVRAQIHLIDPNQPLGKGGTMEQELSDETSGVRAAAARMSIYAAISLLLAVMGNYAVSSFSVARRTQEIGVRMTLGATRGDILQMILVQTARMTALGLAIGLALTIGLTRIMSHALYDVVAIEPLTFVLLTAVLAASALLAGYLPAQRAARIDPVAALRNE